MNETELGPEPLISLKIVQEASVKITPDVYSLTDSLGNIAEYCSDKPNSEFVLSISQSVICNEDWLIELL